MLCTTHTPCRRGDASVTWCGEINTAQDVHDAIGCAHQANAVALAADDGGLLEGNPFPADEIAARLSRVRSGLDARGLAAAVFAAPENVFYLTGLDHWGYFAPHLLLVPAEGEMVLVTRAMEKVTVANHVRNARFE